ncbi:hypothetical protein QL285_023371 [Trifolium repens]|nr:hypothetical protein QL285_023371 [Trifolium repens]
MKKKIRNFLSYVMPPALKGRMQSHVVKGSKEIRQRSCNDYIISFNPLHGILFTNLKKMQFAIFKSHSHLLLDNIFKKTEFEEKLRI